jgi:hypothetical protein
MAAGADWVARGTQQAIYGSEMPNLSIVAMGDFVGVIPHTQYPQVILFPL